MQKRSPLHFVAISLSDTVIFDMMDSPVNHFPAHDIAREFSVNVNFTPGEIIFIEPTITGVVRQPCTICNNSNHTL